MRVVVTGASGNVGTSALQALANDPAVAQIVCSPARCCRRRCCGAG
jgi:uncharacterized protein YbjT (DUF2867 family)